MRRLRKCRTRSHSHVLKRLAVVVVVAGFVSASASAQFEWDKPKTLRPVSNPTQIAANRADVISEVTDLLARNDITIASQTDDETKGATVFVTEPVVFARGIVAKTQLGHFAEVGASEVTNIVRGRVTLRIEVLPSSPTMSLVGASAMFEGLRQGPGQEWIKTTSRGILEDKFLKHVLMDIQGTTFDDVRPDESLLTAGEAP